MHNRCVHVVGWNTWALVSLVLGGGALLAGCVQDSCGGFDRFRCSPIDTEELFGESSSGGSDESSDSGEPLDVPGMGRVDNSFESSECSEQVQESAYCLTTGAEGLYIFGADSGARCELDVALLGEPTSLAWVGDHVLACLDDEQAKTALLTRIDLRTGLAEASDEACVGVAAIGHELYVLAAEGTPLRHYASFDSVLDGDYTELDYAPSATRLSAGVDTILAAGDAGSVVEVHSLSDGSRRSLPLSGYDGRIDGLSLLGDRVFVRVEEDRAHEFATETGWYIRGRVVGAGHGLACRKRRGD